MKVTLDGLVNATLATGTLLVFRPGAASRRTAWTLAAVLACTGAASAQSQFKWDSHDERVESAKQIKALGTEDFGDQIDLQTGALSFTVTDVDIPGNHPLPVRFTRSYRVDNARGAGTNRMLADWEVEVPRLTGRFATDWLSGTSTNRCSGMAAPAVPSHLVGIFDQSDFWQGIRMEIPGAASGELLLTAGATPKPTDGQTYRWFVDGHAHLYCLPSIANGSGEGFMAVTPDGTKYRFNYLAQRPVPGLTEKLWDAGGTPGGTYNLVVRENTLYATRVEDRFGNYVDYTYSNAWNAVGKLTRIASSDGRQIDITYGTNGRIQYVRAGSTTSPNQRTWTYGYGVDASPEGRVILSSVTLPDSSSWQIQFTHLSHSPIVYSTTEEPGRSCEVPAYPQNGYQPPGNPAPLVLTGSVTHPAGATATFTLDLQEHARGNVTVSCSNVTTTPAGAPPGNNNNPNDDHPLFPISWYDWTLTQKQISGPGLSTMTWSYSYLSSPTYVYRTGSSPAFPVCTAGALCYQPTCTSDTCADTAITTIFLPDGNREKYTFGNAWLYNEGKLLKVERQNSAGVTKETVTNTYDLSKVDQAYPARFGTSIRINLDGFTSEYHRPQTKKVVTRDGVNFTNEVIDGTDLGTLLDFDSVARPLTVRRYSGSPINQTITEATTYADNNSRWVRGQVASISCVAPASCAGKTRFSATFDPTWATPLTYSAFNKLQQTLTYNTTAAVSTGQRGTVSSVADGKGQATSLTNWYRGVPRNVGFPDFTSASAVVGDFAQITSTTDQLSYVTSYGYDTLFRLSSISYPTGDTVAWTPKSFVFSRILSAEYGLPAGHWKHTTTHGNYRREVYYDGLWRPVLTREYDNANVAGTSRFTARRFDYAGRETFTSYPVATASSYLSPTQGVTTSFDELGRVGTVIQNSELGNLTTSTVWESGFKQRVTSPRGFVTTTEFQAFDTPDTASPSKITAQISTTTDNAITTILRDVYGKPTSIQRSGTFDGLAVSATRSYVYDTNELLCKRVDPESGASIFEYDGANNVAWDTTGSALTTLTCNRASVSAADKTSRGYDAMNRPTSVTYPSGTQGIGYTYYADGALWTATTTDGIDWTYGYNKRRLLTSEASSLEGMTFTHAYDALGNLSSTTYPVGYVASFAPNALGQPTAATGFASAASYYPNGALKQFTFGNSIVRNVTQNARGLPSRQRDTFGATVHRDVTYGYDQNGNVNLFDDVANLEDRSMTYDGLDRLLTTSAPAIWGSAAYRYDPLDNLREADLGARKHFYVYDTSKWRPTMIKNDTASGATIWSLAHDVRGNLTTKGSTSYTFDRANRLTGIPGLSSTYYYDAHGRRAALVTPTAGTYSLYTRDGKLRGGPDSTKSARLWQVYLGDQLVGTRSEPFSGGAATNTYYHTDLLGSPVKETNQSRVTANLTHYSPYGEATNRTVDGPGYTGHRMDGGSGLIYMQQRFMDPVLGRFLSVDPDPVRLQRANNFGRYHYANGNPYRFFDPDGRNAVAFIGGVVIEAWNAANGRGFDGQMVVGALSDGYNGEGSGFAEAAFQDATTLIPAGAVLRGLQAVRNVANVIRASNGSIKASVELINKAGLSQAQAVRAVQGVVTKSGREVGGVVGIEGGAKVVTGVQVGRGQPIVHVARDGTTSFGTGTVTLTREGGKDVYKVENIDLRRGR